MEKMCDKFMLKYNFICKFKNGLLISNKYAIYNECDMEYKNIFTKKELIYFYIMSLFFFDWLNVINDKINKKFFDKLAQYNAKC